MLTNLIFSLFVLFAPVEKNGDKNTDLNATIKAIDNPKCMDRLMTNWFDYFNKAQERGYDMKRADEIAANIAFEKYLDNCNHK